jgi:hypothetical protein
MDEDIMRWKNSVLVNWGCRLLRTADQAGQMALVFVGAVFLQTELGSIVTDSAIKHIHPSETIAAMFLLLTPNETILGTHDYLCFFFLGLAGSCGEATRGRFGHCSPGEFEWFGRQHPFVIPVREPVVALLIRLTAPKTNSCIGLVVDNGSSSRAASCRNRRRHSNNNDIRSSRRNCNSKILLLVTKMMTLL